MSEGMNTSGQDRDPAMERLLGGLQPARPFIGRDELMFRAGQHSVQRRLRSYQAATATLVVALVAAVGYPLAWRTAPSRQTPDAVLVEGGAPADRLAWPQAGYAPAQPPGEGSLAALRRAALAGGPDALPSPNYLPARDVKVTRWGALAG